ncbi:MAG: hypothetical protein ACR2JQ_11175, partial [Mycobacteriales bacterium]
LLPWRAGARSRPSRRRADEHCYVAQEGRRGMPPISGTVAPEVLPSSTVSTMGRERDGAARS